MAADERIGAVLDNRYRIVSKIASGSMGVIYRGERIKLGRSVAVKVLHTPLANQDRFLQRFEIEAKALSRLSHPNCVSIIDFGVADAPYLVMDLINGHTLKEVIERRALRPPRALYIFRQVLAALAHAHGHGIVHRDVKPGNVMLTEATGAGDHIRILDFGLARLANVGMAEDETGSPKVVGTPFYMSPEQASGKKGDLRSDLYSAGILLFEMLTGTKPFDSEEMLEVLNMHVEQTPPLLRSCAGRQRFSEELEGVVQKALSKKPGHRYQTALDFVDALDRTPEAAQPLHRFHGASKRGRSTEGDTGVVRINDMEPRRSARWVAVLLVVAVLIAGGATYYYFVVLGEAPDVVIAADSGRAPPPVQPAASLPSTADRGPPPPDVATPAVDIQGQRQLDASATPAAAAPSEEHAALPPSGLGRVKALIGAGRRDEAIKELRQMRLRNKGAYLDYLLGKLYFEKRWWTEGMRAYRGAVRKNRSYARRRRLVRDVVAALIDDKTASQAERLITRQIGRAALPHLKQVAKRHKVARMRQRAERVIQRLSR